MQPSLIDGVLGKVLALVLGDALDLNIQQGLVIHQHTTLLVNVLSQARLSLSMSSLPTLKRIRIPQKRFELA